MFDLLEYYKIAIQSLKQAPTKFGTAPHKPILLLSIIDLIENLGIKDNYIPVEKTLKETFVETWNKLVKTDHNCDITKPLFHMQNDGFWTAIMTNGEALDQARGISKIKHGQLEKPLFQLIQSDKFRPVLKMIILDTYFEKTQDGYLTEKPLPDYFNEIETMIWEGYKSDKFRTYTQTVRGYVRNQRFQKAIMKLYDNTCCMSLMKTVPDIGVIEACHIQPHVISGNSHPTNGIPLCRNLHRAFDGGLISINHHYEIVVNSEKVFKEASSPYNFRQLVGKQILLPKEERFNPSLEQLNWHWKRHGFKQK